MEKEKQRGRQTCREKIRRTEREEGGRVRGGKKEGGEEETETDAIWHLFGSRVKLAAWWQNCFLDIIDCNTDLTGCYAAIFVRSASCALVFRDDSFFLLKGGLDPWSFP